MLLLSCIQGVFWEVTLKKEKCKKEKCDQGTFCERASERNYRNGGRSRRDIHANMVRKCQEGRACCTLTTESSDDVYKNLKLILPLGVCVSTAGFSLCVVM